MTSRLDFETRLEARLRARAALASRPFDAAEIARQAIAVTAGHRRYGGLELPSTPSARGWLFIALLVAIALLGALAVAGALLREPDPVPARMTVIEQVIDAVNNRDVSSLRSSFTADGVIEYPAIDARAGGEGHEIVSDGLLHEDADLWMSRVDRWGLEARHAACRPESAATIRCAVRTLWHSLRIEIGEEWTFAFDEAQVTRLQMVRVDRDPPNRVLPLGLGDLGRWEAWLKDTHSAQADRLLPTGPDVFGHWYFRFGLDASPDEIGASIDEYLGTPDPLVGTYVCSQEGNPDAHTWEVLEDGTITRVSGETGEALPPGTWSRDNGRLFTNFQGGMTWFGIADDRLVGPGSPGWVCTRVGS